MSVITSVEPQKKHANRFNIFLDGIFAFGADEDLVVDHRLVVGKKISPEDLEKLFYEAEVGKLMERVYRFVSFRGRSKKEIQDYLHNISYQRKVKGEGEISQLAIEMVVKKLEVKGLVNDLEFAKAWVEARRRSKQKGLTLLKMELQQKGISHEIIEEVLATITDEATLAEIALRKKMKAWKNLDERTLFRKSLEFLLRLGYQYSVAKVAVEKVTEKE